MTRKTEKKKRTSQSDVATRAEAALAVHCLNRVWSEMLKNADKCMWVEDMEGYAMWRAKATDPLSEMNRIEALIPSLPA